MIMALGALQARSQEKLGDRFRSRRRFPVYAIKICGRVLITAPAGRQNVARKLVERLVVGDALADPVMKSLAPFAVERPLLIAQQVGPFQRPEVGKLRPIEEPAHQAFSLLRLPLGNEASRFGSGWKDSEQIEER